MWNFDKFLPHFLKTKAFKLLNLRVEKPREMWRHVTRKSEAASRARASPFDARFSIPIRI